MGELYVVIWPGGRRGKLTPNSFSSALKAHQSNHDDAALYTVTKHSRQEYLAAMADAVLMDAGEALTQEKQPKLEAQNDQSNNPTRITRPFVQQ